MDLARRLVALVGGSTSIRELLGGHQARVFEINRAGQRTVLKVRDASTADPITLATRVDTIAELATIDDRICAPIPIDGSLVTTLDGDDGFVGLVTCHEYADGEAPDPANPTDATLMGSTLAGLHQSMRRIGPKALPPVDALAAVQPDRAGPTQLLHGDFNAGNIRHHAGLVRIFDFDDCGYGPPAFDVANALYMVLFDDLIGHGPSVSRAFDEAFVSGYCAISEHALDLDEVSELIDLRVTALQAWLDEPSTAPVGIRNSPPSWHATLQAFVHEYHRRRH